MTVHIFEGMILAQSPRAVFFQSNYWEGGLWFPKSQIEVQPDGDMSVVVRLKDWLANKRGILEFTHYSTEDIERIAAL